MMGNPSLCDGNCEATQKLQELQPLVAHLTSTSAMDDHDARGCHKRGDPDDPCNETVAAYDRVLELLDIPTF